MGLFEKKSCALCGGKAGLLSRTAISGGAYICGDCRKKFSDHTASVGSLTLDEVREQIMLKEENDRRYNSEFTVTRRFDLDSRHTLMLVDDNHGWFVVPKNNNTDIFTFDQIADYKVELSTKALTDEEKEQLNNRNYGSGVIGFLNLLFSDDFRTKYPDLPHCSRERKVTGMYFQITFGVNPFRADRIRIDMLPGWSDSQSDVENAYFCANNIYQCIKEYKSGARISQGTVQTGSAAQQIRELKELLDIGALTQEEFDTKKKQLLGI